jgi:hypothetical protein
VAALGSDRDAADRDLQAIAIGLLAGLADRHDDAAPIGVARRDRGLDQRRVADGEANPPRRPVRGRAGHRDRDELLRALAVAHDLLGEVDHHAVEGLPEIVEPAVAGIADRPVIALNERSLAAARSGCNTAAGRAASVNR